MIIEQVDLSEYTGVQAGVPVEDKWNYPTIGYNATDGVFYVGEDQVTELVIVPFAIRQCKEVEDQDGMIHRYPIRTPKARMVDGDTTTRLQVVGIVNGELHTFGARSWTARAAWMNPTGGQWHDARFEAGIWPRLLDHIKNTRNSTGKDTAPLCWQVKMEAGEAIQLSSAADAKKRSKGHPIMARSLSFVGIDNAQAYEALYVDEDIDGWVAEWNKATVTESELPAEDEQPAYRPQDDDIPF